MAGRPRKEGVERTASGRIRRANVGGRYVAYLIYVPSRGLFKVGSTGGMEGRLSVYQTKYGSRPVVIAEFMAASGPDARAVEATAIAKIARSGFEIVAHEWVRADIEIAPSLVSIMRESCPELVVGYGGMGIPMFDEMTDHGYAVRSTRELVAKVN